MGLLLLLPLRVCVCCMVGTSGRGQDAGDIPHRHLQYYWFRTESSDIRFVLVGSSRRRKKSFEFGGGLFGPPPRTLRSRPEPAVEAPSLCVIEMFYSLLADPQPSWLGFLFSQLNKYINTKQHP